VWLLQNHQSACELIVGFYKVGSGFPSLTWPESVDEALCFGWIDSIRRRIDETSYQIRFTPRKKGSIWSAVNVGRVNELIRSGRMQAAGLAAFEARSEKRTGIYSFEQEHPVRLDAEELRRFREDGVAWKYFEGVAPGYRKVMTYWVVSAKRPETRVRRFEQLVAACAEGRRLFK